MPCAADAVRGPCRARFSVTLEIDAAALFFPIAEPGGLGAGGAAELARSRRIVRVVSGGRQSGIWRARRYGRGHRRERGFLVSGRKNGVRGCGVLFGSVRHALIVPEF